MKVKKVLRRYGYDVVKYHSVWDMIPKNIATVVDIGANDGSTAVSMRARFPNAFIHSFEPLADAYQALRSTMEGDQKFKGYNIALGEASGATIIYHSASNPSSSLLPMADLHKKLYPHSAANSEEEIAVERLDEVLRGVTLQKPLLVKIDVQGFEASVIKGGPQVLSQADIVLVENSFVTLYEGQALFGEIHDLLQGLGFSYRGRSETHYNQHTKEPIYEDSVFIK